MAKRKRRERKPPETIDYTDAEGNVLRARKELSGGTIRQIQAAQASSGTSQEDAWRRRTEMLFERLVLSWEIAGLPITDQAMLVGRYRMADAETQQWVRRALADHVARHIPELAGP
jgi:hypothetical protein